MIFEYRALRLTFELGTRADRIVRALNAEPGWEFVADMPEGRILVRRRRRWWRRYRFTLESAI